MRTKFQKLSQEHDAAISAALASPVVATPDAVPADVIIRPRAAHEPLPVGAVTRIERSSALGSSQNSPATVVADTTLEGSGVPVEVEIVPENLSQIKGLDPISIMRLNDRGIIAFTQVAKLTDSEVAEIEKEFDLPGCFNRYSWRYQAQQLHLEKNT
ncbi:MAG: hypothetical protein CL417_07425 [Acidimicrobiaceae bacterium]|nr:hypothetical protein [Acidimicrobiaceae bacterium]|tara:strand:+ start:172 stop:642 length:471 start_codon:yes stop_codon:yes gene_type:complete